MGLFGGSSGGSKLTGKSKAASNLLLGSLMPGNSGNGINFEKYWGAPEGIQVGSILEGLPGVTTWDNQGNIINPGESSGFGSVLPSIATIGNYDTLFEKFDAGGLSESGNALFSNFANMATGGTDVITSFLDEIGLGVGGGSGMSGGGGGSVSAPTAEFNAPPNIGELTSDILSSMPPEFQDFTQRVLDSSDPAMFEAELQNFEDKMTAKMMADIDATGDDILDVFAAQGMAGAGAAVKAVAEAATRGVLETNAIIANERIKGLQIYSDRLALGNEITNILLSAGAQEQAHLVQGEIARMNAQMSGEVAALQAQTALQQTAMAQHTQQMGILAGAAVDMFNTQAGMATAAFQGLLSENVNEENDLNNAYMLPYDILMGQSNTQIQKGQGGGFDLGSVIGGGLGLAASLIPGGQAAAPVLNPAGGGASDIRVKENIKALGIDYNGFPLYMFNYTWDKNTPHISVMAQDVEKTRPDLVYEVDGIKHVKLWEI